MHGRRLLLWLSLLLPAIALSQQCDVRDFGAKGDGKHIDTLEINTAIEKCEHIIFSDGVFVTGTIKLLSNRVLEVGKGARLVAAPMGGNHFGVPRVDEWYQVYQDYGHNGWSDSMVHGHAVSNVTVKGEGPNDSPLGVL